MLTPIIKDVILAFLEIIGLVISNIDLANDLLESFKTEGKSL